MLYRYYNIIMIHSLDKRIQDTIDKLSPTLSPHVSPARGRPSLQADQQYQSYTAGLKRVPPIPRSPPRSPRYQPFSTLQNEAYKSGSNTSRYNFGLTQYAKETQQS